MTYLHDFFITDFHTTYAAYPYYGTKIGPLSQFHHGVSGDVYAVDSRTLFLKNFNYDGEAPGERHFFIAPYSFHKLNPNYNKFKPFKYPHSPAKI